MEAVELVAADFARFEIEELSTYALPDQAAVGNLGASCANTCTSSSTCSSTCG